MSTRLIKFAVLGVPLVLVSGGFPFPLSPELEVVAPIRPFDRKDRDTFGDLIPAESLGRMGTTRFRTLSPASASSLSPDGKQIVFPAAERELGVMDTETGLLIRRLRLPGREPLTSEWPKVLLHAPNGERIAVLRDFEVVVIDVISGERLATVPASMSDTRDSPVSFSSDGKRIAVGGEWQRAGAALQVWDVDNNMAVASLKPMQNREVNVSLSADGKSLATWGTHHEIPEPGKQRIYPSPQEGTIQIWDVEKQVERTRWIGAGGRVRAAALSPDGKFLAVTGSGEVALIDLATGKPTAQFKCLPWVWRVWFSPNGAWLASQSNFVNGDGGSWAKFHIWDIASGNEVAVLDNLMGLDGRLVFTGSDRAVVGGVRAGIVALWEAPSGKRLTPVVGHSSRSSSVAFTRDGQTVLSAAPDREVIEWKPATGEVKPMRLPVPPGYRESFGTEEFDGATILSPGGSNVLVYSGREWQAPGPSVFDRASGRLVKATPPTHRPSMPTPLAVFSADGTRFVLPNQRLSNGKSDPPKLPVWEIGSERPIAELPLPQAEVEVTAASFSPDGSRLVTVLARDRHKHRNIDCTIDVIGWDLKSGRKLGEFSQPSEYPFYLAVAAANGTSALVISGKRFWVADFEQCQVVSELDSVAPEPWWRTRDHCQPVFSPDGKRFAVGVEVLEPGKPKTFGIRLHFWPGGKPLHTFTGHAAPVTALAFSPDGRTIASASADTTVLLWDITRK